MKIKNLFSLTILLFLSLLASWFLFTFFDSVAQIQSKKISMGGAAAGFIVIFLLLRNTYFKLINIDTIQSGNDASETIDSLQKQINQILSQSLDNFNIPEGYKSEVSSEFRFGFCYPQNWVFEKFPKQTHYGQVFDSASKQEFVGTRNFNIIIDHIDQPSYDIEKVFADGRNALLEFLPKSQLISEEPFLLHGLQAAKHVIEWTSNEGKEFTLYQAGVIDKEKKKIYWISFTTDRLDFQKSKKEFDDILSTFRF